MAVFSGDDAKTLSQALKLGAERAFSKPVDWESLLPYLSNKREAVVEVNRRARERRAASVDALLRQLGWVVMEKPVTWE